MTVQDVSNVRVVLRLQIRLVINTILNRHLFWLFLRIFLQFVGGGAEDAILVAISLH